MEQWTGSKLGKEYVKTVYCHPVYLTYMQSVSCKMWDWMKHKLESRLQGEIAISICTWHYRYGRKWRRTKEPLDESEREWKIWLKIQHSKNEDHGNQSHHLMAIDGKTMEAVADFIFWGSKITVDGDCSHEIKWCLLLGRKVMTNLDSIFKSRDITLPTKVCLVKAVVFPVVMYGCEFGLWRSLSTEELMLLNCGVGEDSWEFLGLQGDPTSPFWRRSALGFLWKEWC